MIWLLFPATVLCAAYLAFRVFRLANGLGDDGCDGGGPPPPEPPPAPSTGPSGGGIILGFDLVDVELEVMLDDYRGAFRPSTFAPIKESV